MEMTGQVSTTGKEEVYWSFHYRTETVIGDQHELEVSSEERHLRVAWRAATVLTGRLNKPENQTKTLKSPIVWHVQRQKSLLERERKTSFNHWNILTQVLWTEMISFTQISKRSLLFKFSTSFYLQTWKNKQTNKKHFLQTRILGILQDYNCFPLKWPQGMNLQYKLQSFGALAKLIF